jgi:hypothetical protein
MGDFKICQAIWPKKQESFYLMFYLGRKVAINEQISGERFAHRRLPKMNRIA